MATAAPQTNGASAPAPKSKRLTRPDKDAFNADLKKLEADLKAKEKTLQEARKAVGALTANSPKNEEREKLKKELDQLKQKQAQHKNARNKITDEIKQIDERLKRKTKDLNASKSKLNFKSIDELDKHVKDLERKVESGTFRIAEEKKAINEISNLKKLRKKFVGFGEAQASIDEDKAKISTLKASIDDTESKATSARYNEVIAALDAIRDESQKAYKNRNELYDRRNAAQKAHEEAYQKIKARKDEYYGQARAYQENVRAEIAARHERERAEREEADKEKRRLAAEDKLEAASEPAFLNQIATAKMLIQHFDPEYKPDSTSASVDSSLNSTGNKRVVEMPAGATVIKKETEAFVVGTGSKKHKKKSAVEAPKKEDKLTMNFQIVEDLTSLNIAVPASSAEVSKTVEQLKEKLQFYIDNQDRVTKERIVQAKAEIAKLEAQQAAEAKAAAEKVAEATEAKESEE